MHITARDGTPFIPRLKTVYARGPMARQSVLCAGCGTPFGRIERFARVHGPMARFLFEPWYREREGVWQLTAHARRRLKMGQPPALRRPMRKESDRNPLSGLINSPLSYPARVVCWSCDRLHELTCEHLDVIATNPVTSVLFLQIQGIQFSNWPEPPPEIAAMRDAITRAERGAISEEEYKDKIEAARQVWEQASSCNQNTTDVRSILQATCSGYGSKPVVAT